MYLKHSKSHTAQAKTWMCLLLALLLIHAGCTPTPEQLSEPVILTFACDAGEVKVYAAQVASFQERYPGVEIQILPVNELLSDLPPDATDTLETLSQVARHADAFVWSPAAVEGGPLGLIADLTPFIKAGGEPNEVDFLPGLLPHFQWQGSTWGLPLGVDPVIVVYNSTIWKETIGPAPANDWSWDDFVNVVGELTQREGDDVLRHGGADLGLAAAYSALAAHGARLVDDTSPASVPVLNKPAVAASMQQYADLIAEGYLLDPNEEVFPDALRVIQEGKTALSVVPARMGLREGIFQQSSLGLAPLPGGGPAYLTGLFISAGTAHPEMAWRWIQFLSQRLAPPNRLPARIDLIPESAYTAAAEDSTMTVLRYAAEHVLPPVHPIAVERVFERALQRFLEGGQVKAEMTIAQQEALALPRPQPVASFCVSSHIFSPTPTESYPDPAETIVFMTATPQTYLPIARAFHARHPELQVDVQKWNLSDLGDWNSLEKLMAAERLAVSEADCFLAGWLPRSADVRQDVLNLQPFVDADPTFPLEDYLPQTLQPARYAGDLWGIPAGLHLTVLWYNADLFDDAGLAYPDAQWDWEELFQAAYILAADTGEQRRYGYVLRPAEVEDIVSGIAGPLWDAESTPSSFHFDASEVVVATRQLAELVQNGSFPDRSLVDSGALVELKQRGHVGMWMAAARALEPDHWDFAPAITLDAAPEKPDLRPAPLPAGQFYARPVSPAIYYIAADTPHAQACWIWLRFLADYYPDDAFLPPRHSQLASQTFRDMVGTQAQETY